MLKKVITKLELPLTIITLITFSILLVMAFLDGWASPLMVLLLSGSLIFTTIDLISQLKERKNVKS